MQIRFSPAPEGGGGGTPAPTPTAPVQPTAGEPVQIPAGGTPPAPTPPAPGEPQLIAGKFKTQADLEKAYKELETKLGTPKVVDDPVAALAAANVTIDEIAGHFKAHGKLSDEQYAKLRAQGIGKGVADTMANAHVASVQLVAANQAAMRNRMESLVGGASQLQSLLNFAGAALTGPELEAANRDLRDPARYETVIRGLMARHREAVGSGHATPLLSGTAPPSSGRPYANASELASAINEVKSNGRISQATAARLMNTPATVIRGIKR